MQPKRHLGFSLLETVVYIGVLAIVAGVFTGIFQSILTTQISQTAQGDITSQLNFAVQTMQRLVRNSSVIQFEECGATTTLSLLMPAQDQSPTTMYAQNGKLYVQQGTKSPQAVTDENVTVDSLEFKKYCNTGAKDTIEINIAMSKLETATNNRIARSLSSAVSRVNAVTFDSSLLPPTDATYDVGTWPTLRWKDGAFSGSLRAGSLCIAEDCKTSWNEVAQATPKTQYFIIEHPTDSEDDSLLIFDATSTIQSIYAVNKTNGDTVTFNLFFDDSRATATSSATNVFSSYQTNASYTTPTKYTSFANATVSEGQVLRFVTSAASSTQFLLTIHYDEQ